MEPDQLSFPPASMSATLCSDRRESRLQGRTRRTGADDDIVEAVDVLRRHSLIRTAIARPLQRCFSSCVATNEPSSTLLRHLNRVPSCNLIYKISDQGNSQIIENKEIFSLSHFGTKIACPITN